jgi:hypothetical protein
MIRDIGTEDEIFNFVFEGSEFLAKLTEGLDPEKCKSISYKVTTYLAPYCKEGWLKSIQF